MAQVTLEEDEYEYLKRKAVNVDEYLESHPDYVKVEENQFSDGRSITTYTRGEMGQELFDMFIRQEEKRRDDVDFKGRALEKQRKELKRFVDLAKRDSDSVKEALCMVVDFICDLEDCTWIEKKRITRLSRKLVRELRNRGFSHGKNNS